MKKLNFMILGGLMLTCLATRAFAETTIPWTKEGCESVKGTWVTGRTASDSGCDSNHCNGKNFCMSNVQMNWFSALIWCKSIGRELTDLESACPQGLAASKSCANLQNISTYPGAWTSTLRGSTAYDIYQGGIIGPFSTQRTNSLKALCK